jgi:hypothetical protein
MSDRELVSAMGYDIEQRADHAILRTAANGEVRAVAVFLDRAERPDAPSARFDQRTPVDAALLHARREGLRWVLAVRGSTLRLYSSATSGAAGQRGRTETFLELDLAMLETKNAGYLSLLFAADALAEGGTFDEVAAASRDFTSGLSERLRDQVYEHTVPRLAAAIAARHEGTPDKEALDGIYHAALTVLFRLLFVAYAEDRRLLPSDTDLYRAASLKAIAHDLTAAKNEGRPLGFDDPFTGATDDTAKGSSELWSRCRTLFRAVDKGHPRWGIPAYNGGLFDDKSPEGKRIASLDLTDVEFGPALAALILDRTPDGGYGPIDFRSLSVREFGSIYEGLLENELAVAEQDLALKRDKKLDAQVYIPAGEDDEVAVSNGTVYLHNKSGAQKSTGSYFTPAFAVDQLLSTALIPTLEAHLVKVEGLIDAGDEVGAAELLLDFRITDISMGSGHFLTAAVDAIEAGITDLLARKPIPHFQRELERLRAAARAALGDAADGYEIEDSQLVRRLIARKCIYGVDLNPISVELARVSLWIHTFVPGLPLSFLDRTLIVGNSLTGIATVQEAVDALTSSGAQTGLFDDPIRQALKAAEEPLRRLANISDATLEEVDAAKAISAEALQAVRPVSNLFDMIVAHRLGALPTLDGIRPDQLAKGRLQEAKDALANVQVVHFPIAFPEVFLRERGGFDVILGNPPWEEATVERLGFWTAHVPGLKSLPAGEQKEALDRFAAARPDIEAAYERAAQDAEAVRKMLLAGPFPGMGTGDPDLYKAFAWRFLHLVGKQGAIGVVMPRSALSAAGSEQWRRAVLKAGELSPVVMLTNTGGWVFDGVHPQYTVALMTVRLAENNRRAMQLYGPFSSRAEFNEGLERAPAAVAAEEFLTWTPTAALPLLPTAASAPIFGKMRRHRRMSELPFRAVAELHATNDKQHMILDQSATPNAWEVLGGASFNLWTPDTGEVFAWADPEAMGKLLHERRKTQANNKRSAMSLMPRAWVEDPTTLPAFHPRIAFRDITNRTNSRTLIACLLPGMRPLTNKAPYLLRMHEATAADEAFLLGVLASMPMDWQMRRTVEISMNFYILDAAGVPWPDEVHPGRKIVVELAGRLAACDQRFAAWAKEVGVPVGSVGMDERNDLIHQLDAAVARLYGLNSDELRHVYETFHTGWKPEERELYTEAVLEHLESFDWDPAPVGQEQ